MAIALNEAAQVALLAWISISPHLDSVLLKGTTISLISQRSTLMKGRRTRFTNVIDSVTLGDILIVAEGRSAG